MRGLDLNHFSNLNFNNFDSPYDLEENVKRYLCDIKNCDNNVSLIHVNIRNMNSNFEKLDNLLLKCSNSFYIICVTDTWSAGKGFDTDLNFHLPNFDFMHQEKNSNKNGVVF